jgi:hypothetical protein
MGYHPRERPAVQERHSLVVTRSTMGLATH